MLVLRVCEGCGERGPREARALLLLALLFSLSLEEPALVLYLSLRGCSSLALTKRLLLLALLFSPEWLLFLVCLSRSSV
jgi:hypothetical protein